MRKIGEFLLAKDLHAAGIAFLCTLLPLIKLPGGFLASIVVGLVTLRKGWRSGLFVLAWVALPAVALLFLKRFGVFDILLLRCMLVWLFAIVLSQYRSWGLILEFAAVLALVAIAGVHLIVPDVHAWWAAHLQQYLQEAGKEANVKIPAADLKILMERVVPIATGVLGFFIILGTFVQLVLARWWQAYLFKPGMLRQEFSQIRMGWPAAIFAILVVVASFFKLKVAIDFLPVLLLPFMIAGLSLLHLLTMLRKAFLWLLIVVYLGLVFLPYYIVPALAFVGYVDAWWNMRKLVKLQWSDSQ